MSDTNEKAHGTLTGGQLAEIFVVRVRLNDKQRTQSKTNAPFHAPL